MFSLSLVFNCRLLYISRYFSHPDITAHSGSIQIAGLIKPVRVIRDNYGIPHIFAENEHDMLMAIGYVQAQDRLWEMELVRRIATGTLSEIVGDQPIDELLHPARTTLEVDRLSRVIGFRYMGEVGERELIDEEKRARLNAFCDGINNFIELHRDNLPIEFRILGFSPEKWRPAHVISIARFTTWGISENWDVELLRYAILKRTGWDLMQKILPLHSDPGPYIIPPDVKKYPGYRGRNINPEELPLEESLYFDSINILNWSLALSGAYGMKMNSPASNNWVVSGTMTRSSRPILANDPHLPHLMPSVFYLAHIKTPEMNAFGVMFPGTPMINIGFNENVAWGATTTFADTQDIYIEKRAEDDPDSYMYKGKKEKFIKRTESICVKKLTGKKCENLEILMTRHGPVLNSVIPELKNERYLFALRWAGFEKTDEDIAFLALAHAKTLDDFKFAMRNMGAVVQNWVYADVNGNIGFSVSGLVPLRRNHDGTIPVPGWTGEYEWDGFIPSEEMPQVYNPQRGYIITANNQVVPHTDYPYPFSFNYMPSDRAERIEELLTANKRLTPDDMSKIQLDDLLVRGRRFAELFVNAWRNSGEKDRVVDKMVDYMDKWDFRTGIESIATTIFEESMRNALINTLKDELKDDNLLTLYLNSEVTIASFNLMLESNSDLFDNKDTEVRETRDDILIKSLFDAKKWLSKNLGRDPSAWQWGKLHTVTFKHALGIIWPLSEWFNVGPLPHPGSRDTVMAAFYFYSNEGYRTFVGPVMRLVIDMADISDARIALDTGESGLPFTEHYKDLNPLWREGKGIKAIIDEEKLARYKDVLVLHP